jgi:hypothetical protein
MKYDALFKEGNAERVASALESFYLMQIESGECGRTPLLLSVLSVVSRSNTSNICVERV